MIENNKEIKLEKSTETKLEISNKQKIGNNSQKLKSPNKNFSSQEVDLSKSPLFFPEGFEKIFLTIYIISLPYIVGLVFLFIYVANGEIELFLALNEESSFMLTWLIGYEVIASVLLLFILKMSFEFIQQMQKQKVSPTKFQKR